MEIHPDFNELLGLFAEEKVEFVLVGAYALAHHGVPRATGDLDILVRPTPENAQAVLRALARFGFGSLDITVEDLTGEDRVVQLGYPPVRIDLLTSISGLSWTEVASSAVDGSCGDRTVRFLGRDALIRNKLATGRPQDLADVDALASE
jgi:hypothetical protein